MGSHSELLPRGPESWSIFTTPQTSWALVKGCLCDERIPRYFGLSLEFVDACGWRPFDTVELADSGAGTQDDILI